MPTDNDYQEAIKLELNIGTDSTFDSLMPTWWLMYEDKEGLLRYLYAKKRAIAYLLGKERGAIDITIGGDQLKHQQRFNNLVLIMKDINGEIDNLDPFSAQAYETIIVGAVPGLQYNNAQEALDYTDTYYRMRHIGLYQCHQNYYPNVAWN